MHRIDTATADPTANGVGKPGFTNGTPPSVPPTQLNASWFNAVQEEMASIIEGANYTLSASNAQLGLALDRRHAKRSLLASRIVSHWSPATASEATTWRAVCWSPTLRIFVAVANAGTNRVMTSPDGVTWTAASASQANSWQSVCWAPALSLFVAVSTDGANRVMTSPDGTTWTNRTAASAATWFSVCWAEEISTFVAVAQDGSVMTSANGTSWTSRTAAAANPWTCVTWSAEQSLFVAVASSGASQVMTSPTGVTWTSRSASEANQWRSVTWSAELGLFLAVSLDGTNRGMTSPTGTTWTARAVGSRQYNSVVWAADIGIFAAFGSGYVTVSADGTSWYEKTTVPAGGTVTFSNSTLACWAPELATFVQVGSETATQRGVWLSSARQAKSIQGTSTNDSAAQGEVGEYVSSFVNQASATTLVTTTPKTVTSIALTAGDWDISALGGFSGSVTGTSSGIAVGTTTNSFTGTAYGQSHASLPSVSSSIDDLSVAIPRFRVSLSAPATYFMIAQVVFSGGTAKAYGEISARRVR